MYATEFIVKMTREDGSYVETSPFVLWTNIFIEDTDHLIDELVSFNWVLNPMEQLEIKSQWESVNSLIEEEIPEITVLNKEDTN